MATHAITDLAIILKPEDDVAIAKREIAAGTVLEDAGSRIEVGQDIRPEHKVARRARRCGDEVRRYGQVIGFAMQDIAVGDHVHTQNLAVGELERHYEIGTDVVEEDMDINCGVILEGTPLPHVGRQILEEIIAVASGKRSKSELSGVGEEDFAPWIIGPVM